jgi:nucleoside-diphosphate-sugar epimerase
VGLAADAGATAWIGLGSQAEYGPTAAVLNESTPTNPTTRYGAAKLSAGNLTRDLCAERSIRHVWLRLLTAYGPADQPSYLIPHVILTLLRGERPALTEGSQPGDFLHVTDTCNAIRATAVTESCNGTYVLASGDHRPVREVAQTLRDIIDPRLEIGLGEVVSSVPPVGLRGDPRALKFVTGWSPAVPLEAGLVGCVEWYRRNLSRYSKEDAG